VTYWLQYACVLGCVCVACDKHGFFGKQHLQTCCRLPVVHMPCHMLVCGSSVCHPWPGGLGALHQLHLLVQLRFGLWLLLASWLEEVGGRARCWVQETMRSYGNHQAAAPVGAADMVQCGGDRYGCRPWLCRLY
jgi:hypothetical protein